MRPVLFAGAGIMFLSACATQKPLVKPGYDFSRIRTVVVEEVKDYPRAQGSGDAVGNGLAGYLMQSGIAVVGRDAAAEADAIMLCSISDYVERRAVLMPVEVEDKGRTTSASDNAYAESDVMYRKAAGQEVTEKAARYDGAVRRTRQVHFIDAVVGITLQLVDARTGEHVWAATYSYSSLNQPEALKRCLDGALRPLKTLLKK